MENSERTGRFYGVLQRRRGLVSLYYGATDDALTLAGFGVDSFIEVISGVGILAMIARLSRYGDRDRGRFEKLALQITGACFYALVVGLIVGAGFRVWKGQQPTNTVAGIVISLLSIVLMRGWPYGKSVSASSSIRHPSLPMRIVQWCASICRSCYWPQAFCRRPCISPTLMQPECYGWPGSRSKRVKRASRRPKAPIPLVAVIVKRSFVCGQNSRKDP